MRLSIFTKLFFSILLVCILTLLVITFMINTSFKEGLQVYLNGKEIARAEILAEKVKSYYSNSYGWIRLKQEPYIWAGLVNSIGELPPPPDGPHRKQKGPLSSGQEIAFIPLGMRLNLLDKNSHPIIGIEENLSVNGEGIELIKVEIKSDNKIIGYVSILQNNQISGSLAESFFKQQTTHVFSTASITVLLSFLISFFLVRQFLKPLKALSEGAHSIERGELDYHIETRGTDELADLIRVFNRVVEVLKHQKEAREQWLSDISHELRTPITVLRSELEAIQDGIRKPEPQYIDSLHKQILTLGQLVEDLHQLSLSDSGVQIETGSKVLINRILETNLSHNVIRLEQKEITLCREFDPEKPIEISGNEKALTQLFTNLMENTARYTDEGGVVCAGITEKEDEIQIYFDDSAPGVPDHALPRLFERLYRVDKSRSRASGGSGLGLSICQSIVKSHKGTIKAEHSKLGGLRIIITLPRESA